MIVRKRAAIDSCHSEARDILRVHVVVNILALSVCIAARDRGFQIDDLGLGFFALEDFQ